MKSTVTRIQRRATDSPCGKLDGGGTDSDKMQVTTATLVFRSRAEGPEGCGGRAMTKHLSARSSRGTAAIRWRI